MVISGQWFSSVLPFKSWVCGWVFPLWHSGLRIQLQQLGCCGGIGSISSPVQWVKDPKLLQLWRTSQTRLGSGVAMTVVQADSCSSDLTPSQGISICCGCGPKRQKKKKCHHHKHTPRRGALVGNTHAFSKWLSHFNTLTWDAQKFHLLYVCGNT